MLNAPTKQMPSNAMFSLPRTVFARQTLYEPARAASAGHLAPSVQTN